MRCFLPIAESMSDRTAIRGPIRSGRHFDAKERVGILFSRARKEEVQRLIEQIRQNRETLKTISEAILFLSKQELAFRGHDESNDSLNMGNYMLIECFANFKSVFERRLHRVLTEGERVHSGVFTGVSSEIQNDLIECIDPIIQDQIDKETENCRFLSLQVDETTDVSTKEQLSVIIRLDREGEIVERFLKIFDVNSDRCAVAISDAVRSILSRYGESLKEKVMLQTYDGASVMSGQIGGLQTLIRDEYLFAFFFHCAAHRLSLVLCQSASTLPYVKGFCNYQCI